MTDREERQQVIKVLQNMVDWMESINYIVATPERRRALEYAIASIKTDLKYDLLYEETSGQADNQADQPTTKNDVPDINVGNIDCISRADAQTKIEMNASRYTIAKERGGMGQVEWSDQLIKVSDAVDIIRALPSVTPQEPKWIPISERLPEENICDDGYHEPSERVLAYMRSGEMHVARYWSRYDYKWLGIITPTTDEVIAWMPLPQPFKSQESEDNGNVN